MIAITRSMQVCALAVCVALTACGPQIGPLQKGETGKVERVLSGDSLVLNSGLRVFLAEVDSPRGDDDYARQAQAELEALALHRNVQLAYGGAGRWTPVSRNQTPSNQPAPPETAIAHVFVQSEGGRWFWLQQALVSRGAAYVRPRRDNHARSAELVEVERRARASQRGMWARRAWRTLSATNASHEALENPGSCWWSGARYRFIEGKVKHAVVSNGRAALELESEANAPRFSVVAFGQTFSEWDGPAFDTLEGARIRVRGRLGVFRDEPQLCLEDARQLEVLTGR